MDQYLEQALKTSGIAAEIKAVKAIRREDNRQGDLNLLSRAAFGKEPQFQDRLTLSE